MSRDSIDLRLRLGTASDDGDRHSSTPRFCRVKKQEERQQQGNQQITIFYNGQICIRNVTELQARAIICMATSEMDDQLAKEKESSPSQLLHHRASVRPPLSVEQQLLMNPKLPMKRSLQRFLQKRKSRSLAISPYYMHTSSIKS
ncbi:protein TIFY 5A [Curcuma longa]|uniref:protein TIFY 5A n=1 Tax=Curcuma longa TaxID=136217 RepID=UPI003D9EB359